MDKEGYFSVVDDGDIVGHQYDDVSISDYNTIYNSVIDELEEDRNIESITIYKVVPVTVMRNKSNIDVENRNDK